MTEKILDDEKLSQNIESDNLNACKAGSFLVILCVHERMKECWNEHVLHTTAYAINGIEALHALSTEIRQCCIKFQKMFVTLCDRIKGISIQFIHVAGKKWRFEFFSLFFIDCAGTHGVCCMVTDFHRPKCDTYFGTCEFFIAFVICSGIVPKEKLFSFKILIYWNQIHWIGIYLNVKKYHLYVTLN